MKILVTSIVDLKKTAHNRLHQFVRYLAQNHEVTVLSINDWWKANQTNVELYAKGYDDILNSINMKYFTHKKVKPVYQEMVSIINLNEILQGIEYQQFDVHLNYNSLFSGYFVARKVNSVGVKTVYDIADDLPAMIGSSPQIPSSLRRIGRFLGKQIFRKNINIAEKITIITEALRRSLEVPLSKSVIIPNGVDTELFSNRLSPKLRSELGMDDAFVLGYVGVLREWVDLESVFQTVRDLCSEQSNMDIKVLIVGEEGGLAKNKALAQKYGILDKTIFTGTVPYTKVPEYISCMDVCLIPFKNDAVSQNALPLKLFEYMACEKPVISTKVEGIIESVGDMVLYASNTSEYMSEITKLYNEEELRRRLGSEGRMFVEKNYNWSNITSKLEKILLGVSS